MTQLEKAKRGEITEEIQRIAADECLDVEIIRSRVASGKIVLTANKHRN